MENSILQLFPLQYRTVWPLPGTRNIFRRSACGRADLRYCTGTAGKSFLTDRADISGTPGSLYL